MSPSPDVFIVGAGLAGLCCARELQAKGVSFQILEASDGIGGRVRTDEVDGFLLDRGFQVLLTAYPEAKRCLDYSRLELKPFLPGVLSWYAGRMNKLVDPWRMPGAWKEAFRSEFGTLAAAPQDARFAAAVAGFAELLRGGKYSASLTYEDVMRLAIAAKGRDEFGYRSEFVQLVRAAKSARTLAKLDR